MTTTPWHNTVTIFFRSYKNRNWIFKRYTWLGIWYMFKITLYILLFILFKGSSIVPKSNALYLSSVNYIANSRPIFLKVDQKLCRRYFEVHKELNVHFVQQLKKIYFNYKIPPISKSPSTMLQRIPKEIPGGMLKSFFG